MTAVTILDRGDTMAMYAEGGRSRTGELSTKPRRGIGRLALLSGAPVVPVAIVGSSHVRNWKRLQFPKVTVHYGEPFAYERVEAPTRDQEQAAADAIFAEVRALYDKATPPARPPEPRASARPLAGDEQGDQRARGEHRRADPRRARQAVGEGLRRRVGAVGGEHRGQHGDAQRPADLADRVRRARGLTGLLRADGVQDRVGRRREHQRHARAGQDERDHERAVGDGRASTRAPASRSRSPAAPARSPSAGASRCGPRAGPRSARRASASPSTAACAGRPPAATSPA